MPHPYTVALVDASELPSKERIAAEARFAAAIERALGGAEQVALTYKAWEACNEEAMSDLDKPTVDAAMRWPRAADAAQKAGFRDLGEFPGAYFEVRLEKHTA